MTDTTTIETTEEKIVASETDGLGDAGKKALEQERDARKTAEKTARETRNELDTLKAAKAKEDEDKQAEQGKWQELAEKREASLNETTTNLESATTELETLRAYVSTDVETVTKQVKEIKDDPAAKVLLKFHPGDDASVPELLAWAKEAKAGLADITTKPKPRGSGFDPTPSDRRGKVTSPLSAYDILNS